MKLIIASGLSILSATAAIACSPMEEPTDWVDRRIDVALDGSFERAGAGLNNMIAGAAPVDIGDGRVGQRIETSGGCYAIQQLLFVDCRTGDIVMLDGRIDPSNDLNGIFNFTEISELQAPKGALNWDEVDTVDDVVAVAIANDYDFTRDVVGNVAQMKRRNRYDPFNGCKILYPNSAGASL